jgi:hypothetical protein
MASEKPKLNVNVDTLPLIQCKRCRGTLFKDVVVIKKLSALLSPTGKDEVMPFPIFVCNNCNLPLDPRDVGITYETGQSEKKPEDSKESGNSSESTDNTEKRIVTP